MIDKEEIDEVEFLRRQLDETEDTLAKVTAHLLGCCHVLDRFSNPKIWSDVELEKGNPDSLHTYFYWGAEEKPWEVASRASKGEITKFEDLPWEFRVD